MAFDTLTPSLKGIATRALAFCKAEFGSNSLAVDSAIHKDIPWRPTFSMKPTSSLIVAVEVADNLYPEALRGAAHEITQFDFPIAVYQACSLELYQSDRGEARVNLLRRYGFGLITVDADGRVTPQFAAVPLAQHISKETLNAAAAGLNRSIRIRLNAAHTAYAANAGQGLQLVGQVIEGLIACIAKQAADEGLVAQGAANGDLADAIDALYTSPGFSQQRAALGAARAFVREFRNTASHAPKNGKQAAAKMRRCRAGFLNGVELAKKLRQVLQAHDYQTKIYVV